MPSEGSVLRLPVGNGLECAVFGKLPRAAFGLGKQCGGFRVGFGDVGETDDAEVVRIVGVFVGLVAAEETPAAVVFKNGGFAVEEADGLVLFGDGVGGDTAVECRGKCLCKCVHCGNTLGENLRILPRFLRCRQTAAVWWYNVRRLQP